jgi:Domain of unknown function (DUF4288)
MNPSGNGNNAEASAAVIGSSGWFAVQLRYAYLVGEPGSATMIEDRVILVDGDDEDHALGRAVELAPQYEDELESEGEGGRIRFEGIVAIKELDDPPATGTEVWHEFMSPDPARPTTDHEGEPLPPVYPEEMAFPRASDD